MSRARVSGCAAEVSRAEHQENQQQGLVMHAPSRRGAEYQFLHRACVRLKKCDPFVVYFATPFGMMSFLPRHPMFWAGFIVVERSQVPITKMLPVNLVYVNDWQALSAAPLRLVGAGGSSANVGLIQVQSEGGSFGTVCGLNVAAADVACRQLGGAP